MTDFATLVLNADSRGLKSGEQALNSLASTSEKTERIIDRANDNVAKGFKQVGDASVYNAQRTRMMAMQLSQVAQQASATGNWVQALAIQLPDLALGFGPIGIAAGVAAGALLPLIANMVTGQEEAESLADAVKGLQSATEAYESAASNASLSASDLIEKFGNQAVAAQEVYEVLRRLAELRFYEAMREQQQAVAESLGELTHSLGELKSALDFPDFMGAQKLDEIRVQTENLAHTFGLTVAQANEINNALDALGSADGPEAAAKAAMDLSDAIDDAAAGGAKIPPEMRSAQTAALEAAEQALRFSKLVGGAIPVANSLAGAMSGVADQAQRAAQWAAALTARYPSQGTYAGVERSADGPIQGSGFMLPEVGPTPESRGTPELSGFPWEKFGGGGGRKGRRGGGGGKSDAEQYQEIIDAANRRIETLKAERDALGMTEEAAAKLRNETELLNDAQQKGINLTDPQREKLASLAETMAQVEEETRRATEQQEFFQDIGDDLKNGIIDSIVEGEKLGDVFQDLAKSIAKAALEAALFGSGPLAGGSGGGGGGLLGGVLGGFLKLFSFDGGGYTGSGSRSGGVDGKGGFPALLHPNETVVDHTKGGGAAGSMQVSVVSRFDANGNFESNVERISDQRVAKAGPGIVKAANQRVVPTMAQYQAQKAGGDYRLG